MGRGQPLSKQLQSINDDNILSKLVSVFRCASSWPGRAFGLMHTLLRVHAHIAHIRYDVTRGLPFRCSKTNPFKGTNRWTSYPAGVPREAILETCVMQLASGSDECCKSRGAVENVERNTNMSIYSSRKATVNETAPFRLPRHPLLCPVIVMQVPSHAMQAATPSHSVVCYAGHQPVASYMASSRAAGARAPSLVLQK